MITLIEAKNLQKSYNGREVVKGIDLAIHKGEIVALIGPNGTGKSTTISMLFGIVKPDAGSVSYWREDYKAHAGVQLQSTPFFEGYTAEENLQLFSALYHANLTKEQIAQKLMESGLLEVKKTQASRMSIGQQKRLAIVLTTLNNPDLIVLDEPTAGLDPRGRHEIKKIIKDLAQNNVSVLFSSHDMEEVAQTADRVILINQGKIIAQGSPALLLYEHKQKDLEALYLTLTETV